MNLLSLLILFGAIQGCTEVFPISSSGHLALARQFLNYNDFNLALAAGLHGGSLLAIFFYFHKDLAALWSAFQRSLPGMGSWIRGRSNPFVLSSEQNLPYYMALSLVPVILEGWSLESSARQVFEQTYWVSIFLMINAVLLMITSWETRGERTLKEFGLGDFLLIGLVQGVAVLPGISRLGVVVCTGLWRRLNWQEALKLAFLLAIPVLAGGVALESGEILALLKTNPGIISAFILGGCASAFSSYIGLRFFTSRYLERRRLAFFGSYCLLAGIVSLNYLLFWL